MRKNEINNLKELLYRIGIFLAILTALIFFSTHLKSQPYRLASIEKRTTKKFYYLTWESLGDGLRFQGVQNGLSKHTDLQNIKSYYPASPYIKDFEPELYAAQYWSSRGMNLTLFLDTGYYKTAFHFLNFPFQDTTRKRVIDIYLVKDGRRSKGLNINLSEMGFYKHFTYHMEGIKIDSAQFVRFEIITDSSKSVKDNYVTLSAFELIDQDSLFSYELPLLIPIESDSTTLQRLKVQQTIKAIKNTQNALDSLTLLFESWF